MRVPAFLSIGVPIAAALFGAMVTFVALHHGGSTTPPPPPGIALRPAPPPMRLAAPPAPITATDVAAMELGEIREALKSVSIARRAYGHDPVLRARLKGDFELLLQRLRSSS